MNVARICSREVSIAAPTESVVSVAKLMRDRNVGTVVIVDEGRMPVGIVTDRDIVTRVLAAGVDSRTATIGGIMTRCPRTVPAGSAPSEALACMRRLGVRRLPVVGERGELVGILSVDDVLQSVAEELGNLSLVIAHSVGGARVPTTTSDRTRPSSAAAIPRASGEVEC